MSYNQKTIESILAKAIQSRNTNGYSYNEKEHVELVLDSLEERGFRIVCNNCEVYTCKMCREEEE